MQRLRLLVADLVVFDRHRLGWRLAARTLLLSCCPSWPPSSSACRSSSTWRSAASWSPSATALTMATARSSCASPLAPWLAGRRWPVPWWPAALSVSPWSECCSGVCSRGLLGIYGTAFATMGLPIAWAYVEVGLPASRPRHPIRRAVLGALWIAGGCLAALLTLWVRTGDADATLRHRCADCYRALAHYFEALRQQDDAVVSPETRLRAAIGEARRIAANRRPAKGAANHRLQRQMALIDIADRLFSEAARLREQDVPGSPALVEALDALAALSRMSPVPRLEPGAADRRSDRPLAPGGGQRPARGLPAGGAGAGRGPAYRGRWDAGIARAFCLPTDTALLGGARSNSSPRLPELAIDRLAPCPSVRPGDLCRRGRVLGFPATVRLLGAAHRDRRAEALCRRDRLAHRAACRRHGVGRIDRARL